MCGIAGMFVGASNGNDARQLVARMTKTIDHRGPDDEGLWSDTEAGIHFGFRRLAIIDLSEQGRQPMTSASGRFVIIFNGEVYNHNELRRELLAAGFRFRGHSDTEVLLAAFEHWGIERAVPRFVGMFAIAVWDRQRRSLSLIRDRLGIKPVFVHARSGVVSFGSELKALVEDPGFDRTIDRDALTEYLRHLYVPAPRTIYSTAKKLRPGHILTITDPFASLPQSRAYWSLDDVAVSGVANPFEGSDEEALADFDRQLVDAVRIRMQADVPLGALLSGGIDSSVVVAIMQESADRPVKTFSVGFDVAEHNEAPHAKRLAAHLGTDHTEILLSGKDALDVVPRLPDIFDEPHADAAQIPALLVCQAARRHVTVALSGDGGDEVYGGYNRYTYGARMLERVMRVPRPARRALSVGIGSLSAASWGRMHRSVAPALPRALQQRLAGEKISKMGRLLAVDTLPQMYRSLLSAWQDPEQIVLGGHERAGALERTFAMAWAGTDLERMMLTDQVSSLPDDHLAKVDRVSSAVSLEARVPLLDHRLVEFSWRLPSRLKIREARGKIPLRESLYRRVPRELVDRPKVGFTVPLAHWLRGPLRDWASDLLEPDALSRNDILRAEPIRFAWSALLAGQDEHALPLWAVLMFQAWRGRWLA
jgi:asparagine synthase (glutamine-hydrolysing)